MNQGFRLYNLQILFQLQDSLVSMYVCLCLFLCVHIHAYMHGGGQNSLIVICVSMRISDETEIQSV